MVEPVSDFDRFSPAPRRAELDGRTAARLFEQFERLDASDPSIRARIVIALKLSPKVVDAAYEEYRKGSLDNALRTEHRREKTLAEVEREKERDRDFERSLVSAQRQSDATQARIRALRLGDDARSRRHDDDDDDVDFGFGD